MIEIFDTLWSVILSEAEFWSAIAGAVVGGGIAYVIQLTALREGRRQREQDHKQRQQALGNSLLFKVIRIHSNFHGIHRHIEDCLEQAARRGDTGEPWQFVLPLANPPAPVHFSADEMGMLMSLKSDDVFNEVVAMDDTHNSLIDAIKVLNTERRALTERLKADQAEDQALSGTLDRNQWLAIRPRMIEVNSLIDSIRDSAKEDFERSDETLARLQVVLQETLGLAYKIESKVRPKGPLTPASPEGLSRV